jgi:hypothetical protein
MEGGIGLIGNEAFEKVVMNRANCLKVMHFFWHNAHYPTKGRIHINNFLELVVHDIDERYPSFTQECIQVKLSHHILMVDNIDNLLCECALLVTCLLERHFAMHNQQPLADICGMLYEST